MLFKEIPYQDPINIFQHFQEQPWAMWLDSNDVYSNPNDMNRYSYIALNPFATITYKNGILTHLGKTHKLSNPFEWLNTCLSQYTLETQAKLPPFQGGALGLFGYDLCHDLEPIARNNDDMQFNDMAIGLYDLVISFDHHQQQAWIIASQYNAATRLAWLEQQLTKRNDITRTHITLNRDDITANFTQSEYEKSVATMIDYIRAGDIFEANMTQRFRAQKPENLASFEIYERLRHINSAPFSAYLNLGDTVIASASPERFLKLQHGKIETRPIKGTRPRGKTPEQDAQLKTELSASEKDISENVMIVDLMRNDLSRVCQPHSVNVPQLCGLETFTNVHHLVSVVQGTMRQELNALDLLQATFPGGSITGAPKVRAMQLISELEPTQRGPYCGSIGFVGFDGCLDTSIVIRTFAIKNNIITFQAGGAIVLDSNPTEEYEESLSKAEAFHRALTEECLT